MSEKYVIYGAGKTGEVIRRYTKALGMNVVGFFDRRKDLQGTKVEDTIVLGEKEIEEYVENNITFIIGSRLHHLAISNDIHSMYGNETKVISVEEIANRYWEEIVFQCANHKRNNTALNT